MDSTYRHLVQAIMRRRYLIGCSRINKATNKPIKCLVPVVPILGSKLSSRKLIAKVAFLRFGGMFKGVPFLRTVWKHSLQCWFSEGNKLSFRATRVDCEEIEGSN